MTPVFKKLNYKSQEAICIVNAPLEFKEEIASIKEITTVKTDIENCKEVEFILTFVKTQTEIDQISPRINDKLKGDGIVWFAYPKGSSKRYKVDIGRDKGWEILGKLGFERVRAVAIDEDWSALRFRRVDFIKVMKRNSKFAMTSQGKKLTHKANSKNT